MPKPAPAFPIFFGCETALHVLAAFADRKAILKPYPYVEPIGRPLHADRERAINFLTSLKLDPATTGIVHITVGDTRCKAPEPFRYHQWTRPVAGSSARYLAEGLFTMSAPAAFIQLAKSLPLPQLILLGDEICGTYRRARFGQSALQGTAEALKRHMHPHNEQWESSPNIYRPASNRFAQQDSTQDERLRTIYDRPPLASTKELRAFAERNPQLPGSLRARRALPYIVDGSASPRESQFATLLALPMRHGGYGLGAPSMNVECNATRDARTVSGRRSLRCDLFWPGTKLDVEYQSREFHQGEESRISDSRRANALRAMGYSVMQVTNSELDSLRSMDVIAKTIQRERGKRFRVSTRNFRQKQIELRRSLGLPIEPNASPNCD